MSGVNQKRCDSGMPGSAVQLTSGRHFGQDILPLPEGARQAEKHIKEIPGCAGGLLSRLIKNYVPAGSISCLINYYNMLPSC